jgi:hypothetical protein
MRKMTIGVRGRGVLISHLAPDNARLITTRAARRYARLLLEAAEEAERNDPLEPDGDPPAPPTTAPPATAPKAARKTRPEGDRMKRIADMVSNGLLPEDIAKTFNISRAAAIAAVWRARKAGLVEQPNGATNTP